MPIKWGPWESLGRPRAEVSRPFVQSNQDGRLEVFAVGQGEIFNCLNSPKWPLERQLAK